MSAARIAFRAALIAASLAAIFGALIAADVTHALWVATLAAVAAFYTFAHAAPRTVFRLQSMPYTYQIHNNWGPRAFELQNVTYAAYHTHWYNHATHAAFPLEAGLWFVAIAYWAGPRRARSRARRCARRRSASASGASRSHSARSGSRSPQAGRGRAPRSAHAATSSRSSDSSASASGASRATGSSRFRPACWGTARSFRSPKPASTPASCAPWPSATSPNSAPVSPSAS